MRKNKEKVTISVRMPKSLYAKVVKLSDKTGYTKAVIIQQAIERFLGA